MIGRTLELYFIEVYFDESAQNYKYVGLIVLIKVKVYLDDILTYKICLETLTYINVITRSTIDRVITNLLNEKH